MLWSPFRRLLFLLWIIQEAPCFVPCGYVVKEIVFISHIDEVTVNADVFFVLFVRVLIIWDNKCWQMQCMFNILWRILWQLLQIFFCLFTQCLVYAEHLLDLLKLLGCHFAYNQHFCVHYGSICASLIPDIFWLLYHRLLVATWLVSLLVISIAKHKIWYSCIQFQAAVNVVMNFDMCCSVHFCDTSKVTYKNK
jgi:hypothetical protein